jgi:oxygen-independent coproporphyrinogen-3 oxidase
MNQKTQSMLTAVVDAHGPAAARAVYVHVPFCQRRCGYCNFTLVAGRDDLIDGYLDAIERELCEVGGTREINTLFLGGGTPTHLPPDKLRRLIASVRHWFSLVDAGEFSIEANPSDCTPQLVELLADLGVTRISLGAQSFDARKLRALDRDHSADQIRQAVALCRPVIASISLDLIFGVPDESLAVWSADLDAALELRPQHISTYGLTFERGTSLWTRWHKNDVERVDEGLERDMFARAIDSLAAAGFEHYEVSNFARPGHRCRHNEAYWAGDEYYAFGPGAARHLHGTRAVNHRSTTTYIKRVLAGDSPVAEFETLSAEDRARETLVIGLRRMRGVNRSEFARRTGFDLDSLAADDFRRFVAQGLLEDDGVGLRLTRDGLFVSDSIWPYLVRA